MWNVHALANTKRNCVLLIACDVDLHLLRSIYIEGSSLFWKLCIIFSYYITSTQSDLSSPLVIQCQIYSFEFFSFYFKVLTLVANITLELNFNSLVTMQGYQSPTVFDFVSDILESLETLSFAGIAISHPRDLFKLSLFLFTGAFSSNIYKM